MAIPLSTVLAVFVVLAGALWLSVFGYLVGLRALAIRRRSMALSLSHLPPLAVVVPTLDEETFIGAKVADVLRADYPHDRLRLVVVDGGSADRTCEMVRRAASAGGPVRLMRLEGLRNQAEQVRRALEEVSEDVVVVTDADARLEPGCLRALVGELMADPELAVAGAVVRPHTRLMEEQLYGRIRNHLWWLEGEALSSATVSGACYALRRSAFPVSGATTGALDVRLAAAAAARGKKVRLCLAARASEVRVPQSLREFVQFRRRRGAGYLTELLPRPPADAPWRWRLARAVRLWHFLVAPLMGAVVAALALALMAMGQWSGPLLALAAFSTPPLLAVLRSRPRHWPGLVAAGARLVLLTGISLLALDRATDIPRAVREAA